MNVYGYTVEKPGGEQVSLRDYEGKVLLIVNTATGCGFTPQYEDLEKLYAECRDRGFEVLDFPCNQFANQAPGDDEEIHQFCTLKFGTEFPQFNAKSVDKEFGDKAYIKWNFTKFLVDRTGEVVARFEPTVDMKDVADAVRAQL